MMVLARNVRALSLTYNRAYEQHPMSRTRQSKNERRRRFEQFEQRLVMSAQGIGVEPPDLNQLVTEIAPLVADVSTDSGESNAANSFGFDGSGQTIAIIDSGIAWDHAALGNGFGYGNKVVGGWDFAENDSNPYDDGPAGFHGTHVAGIAAGNGNGFQGVAPGADLVGLRVFNDQGIGKIEWVESALQWVRDNLDSFQNPITTINMSLGSDWETETASDWDVITDELASLKEAGVFISVAAGNDFQDLFSKTLSHTAANEHVVAVASHDANNMLSDFSQRDDHVLVAPGESISSTVPNHLFGNRKTDQLLGASGTSMAAPYVAGASAILRQAYGAMGYGEVDQDTLYQTFWETSNKIYDSITQTTFRQLDLDAAIASITQNVNANNEVTQVGTISGGEVIRGTINNANTVDNFSFTASETGQIELDFEATDQFDPTLEITNSAGQVVDLEFESGRAYLNVIGGESYQLEVASQAGSGHYQITTQFQATSLAQSTDLGIVDSLEVTDFILGERTYAVTASNSGPIAFGFASDSQGTIEVYDANMNRLTVQQTENGRVDFQFEATRGESLFVQLKANGEVELSVDNLVSIDNGTLTVNGTESADSFVISDDNLLRVEVNNTQYSFQHAEIRAVVINGDATMDSLQLSLSDRYERTVLRQHRVDAFNGTNTLRAIGFQTIDVTGSGTLTVAGSEADDSIVASYESATIAVGDLRATGHGFEKVIADGKGGHDSIRFEAGGGNDILFSRDDYTAIRNGESRLIAINYQSLDVDAGGGYDITNLFGSERRDHLSLGDSLIQSSNGRANFSATGFERVTAFSGVGDDTVVFTDSEGNDRFLFADGTSQLVTDSAQYVAHNFESVAANSTCGDDVAQIRGSRGNDQLTGSRETTSFQTGSTSIELTQFNRINVVGSFQGNDTASLIGTDGNDVFTADGNSASAIFDGGAIVRTVGFGNVSFAGGGGFDTSFYAGTAGADILEAGNTQTRFRASNITVVAREVEATHFDGHGGGDSVFIDDAVTLDVLAALGDSAIAVLENHQRVEAQGFDFLEANAVDGVIATYDMERVDFQSVLRGTWRPR